MRGVHCTRCNSHACTRTSARLQRAGCASLRLASPNASKLPTTPLRSTCVRTGSRFIRLQNQLAARQSTGIRGGAASLTENYFSATAARTGRPFTWPNNQTLIFASWIATNKQLIEPDRQWREGSVCVHETEDEELALRARGQEGQHVLLGFFLNRAIPIERVAGEPGSEAW